MSWMLALFSGYRWFRRWYGGHWECWWNEVTQSYVWERLESCTQTGIGKHFGTRPPCCHVTPNCEDWPA